MISRFLSICASGVRPLTVALAWCFLYSPVLWMWPSGRSLLDVLVSALVCSAVFLWRRAVLVMAWALWLIGTVHLGYFFAVGSTPDEYFWFTLSASHAHEALEYVRSYRWHDAVQLVVWSVLAGAAALWLGRTARGVQQRWVRVVLMGLALVWPLWAIISAAKGDSVEAALRKINRIYPMAFFESLARQQAAAAQIFTVPSVAPPPQPARADLIVVVLGESASAQRWSLLGYAGNDTNAALRAQPLASSLRALPVLANGNNTAQTVPVLLSGCSIRDSTHSTDDTHSIPTQGMPTYLDWARAAGFRVVTVSNQSSSGTQETFFHSAYHQRSHSYQRLHAGAWDEELSTPVHTALSLADAAQQPLLVTLHTYGSHPRVAQRTPPEHAHWSDPYDNSIAYSSMLLAQWIDMLQTQAGQRRAVLLYISDHGLNLPECGGQYTHGSARSAYEVPMLVWGNAAFQADQPDWWQRLTQHAQAHITATAAATAATTDTPRYDNRVLSATLADLLGYQDSAYPSLGAPQTPAWPQLDGQAYRQRALHDACQVRATTAPPP